MSIKYHTISQTTPVPNQLIKIMQKKNKYTLLITILNKQPAIENTSQ